MSSNPGCLAKLGLVVSNAFIIPAKICLVPYLLQLFQFLLVALDSIPRKGSPYILTKFLCPQNADETYERSGKSSGRPLYSSPVFPRLLWGEDQPVFNFYLGLAPPGTNIHERTTCNTSNINFTIIKKLL